MVLWVSIGFGTASAGFWLASALLTPAVQGKYWGGPPQHIEKRLKRGAALNAAGAACAAIAMACQAFATWQAL